MRMLCFPLHFDLFILSFTFFFFDFLRFLCYESIELELEERCYLELLLVGKINIEEIDHKHVLWCLIFPNFCVSHLPFTSLFFNLLDFLGTQAAWATFLCPKKETCWLRNLTFSSSVSYFMSFIRFVGVVDIAWFSGALIFSILPQISKLLSVIGFLRPSFKFFLYSTL